MAYKPHKFIRDKIAKTQSQKQFWQTFLIEAGLFLTTTLLSAISAFQLNKLVQVKKVYMPATSSQDFFFSFLFITFFVLLFISYKKAGKLKEIIYKGIFLITCFWGGMTVLNLFLPVFVSVLIMGILIFFWIKKPSVWAHDILIIVGLAGAASFLGLGFSPSAVIILLLIFSIYDFIAVYKNPRDSVASAQFCKKKSSIFCKIAGFMFFSFAPLRGGLIARKNKTKHMVAMAKEMIEKKVIFGFIIPKELKYFKDGLDKVKPASNFMILGGGDVIFPSLLAISVIPQGFLQALIIIVFSLAGLFLTYWIFSKEKESLPALPPIAFCSILGYLITLLLP